MQNSQLNSLSVPAIGSPNPATLFVAALVPIRIVITNIGTNLVYLAHDPSTLQNFGVGITNTYLLPAAPGPGSQVTLVLAPSQGVYAAGVGVGGQVSIAVSEALPVGEAASS